MATKLSTLFLSSGFGSWSGKLSDNPQFPQSSRQWLNASCKMRPRHLSSRRKRKQWKKASYEHSSVHADFHPNDDEDSGNEIVERVPTLDQESLSSAVVNTSLAIQHITEKEICGITAHGEIEPSEFWIEINGLEMRLAETDVKLKFPRRRCKRNCLKTNGKVTQKQLNFSGGGGKQQSNRATLIGILLRNQNIVPIGSLIRTFIYCLVLTCNNSSRQLNTGKVDTEGPNTGLQIKDLIGMLKNAEKNILLLNEARIRTLKDLEKILAEKEELQKEINGLEMRLAETDARNKVAAQEKVPVELLEDQFDKLQKQLNFSGGTEQSDLGMHGDQNNVPIDSLTEELHLLRSENVILKNDIQKLQEELSNVNNTHQHLVFLEKERSILESSLKDLEFKLSTSQEDVSELSALKVECKDLRKRVEDLQMLLDKSAEQEDQATLVMQQNQELQEKVGKLEASLEEANVFKFSYEKFQQDNKLMQQKIDVLEDRLQKSDHELHSYIKLYQESVREFQDTLDNIKEASKKKAIDEPVNDMPMEFWSRLLLLIDGWLLEKKISGDDAKLLKEMAWKRDARIYDAYMACKEKNELEAVAMFLNLTSSPKRSGLYVIHIAAEMAPVAKVGGLGDVITGLSKALQRRGHLVEIVLPKYDCMQYNRIKDLRLLDMILESYFDGRLFKNKIWVGTVEGLPVYFIEPHHPDKFFWRAQYYGEHDDFKRFSYFSRAALELLLQAGKRPDIIHCHDWQTAFIAPLYWDLYYPNGLNSARICFTCHNFEYQGAARASDLASCGLNVDQLNRQDRLQDNSSHDRINPVKGAVVFSNIVTTVSPTYAQEVRRAEGGHGLHSTLNFHSKKFFGILNGIDTDVWNPTTDAFIKVQYNANDLEGKAENKDAIRRHLGLSSNVRKPLVGCITRLVPQKGIHLIRYAIYRTLELGGQFVLLGSSPVPHIQREFEEIANKFQSHDQIRLVLAYDESLSHWIYAGSDMLIIPSIFEPCGLTQMIAMRYGSIPIVRKTGGLNDSVFDVDDDTIPTELRNGYTFLTPDEQGMNNAMERAFDHYLNNPGSWEQLVQKVMDVDFSWETSAAQYEELYSKSVARARAAAAGRA